MDAIDLIHSLHEHRVWANRLFLDAAESLSDEQLRRAFPIGRGSIWKSLLHLYAAEWGWFEVLQGDTCPTLPGDLPDGMPGNQEGEGAMQSLSELKDNWRASEGRWAKYLAEIDSESLDQPVHSDSDRSPGTIQAVRTADVLLHLSTYTQSTTADVYYMLQQVGAEKLPNAMLITWARQQKSAR